MYKRKKYKSVVITSAHMRAKEKAKREAQIVFTIDGIVDFQMHAYEKNRLMIKVHWEGYEDIDNSWVPYEELYTNEVLKTFINNYRKEHETEIFMILENIKQKLKSQIRTTLRTKSSAEITLTIVQPFDYLEYQVMQVACHLLKDRLPDNMLIRLSSLTLKNYFFQLERVQQNKHQQFIDKVNRVCNINLEIENYVDFDMFNDFTYIPKNIIPCQFRSAVNFKPEGGYGCNCVGRCSVYSQCCPKRFNKPFSYRNDCRFESKDLILKHAHDNEIIECGPYCNCSISCRNRVTQRPSPFTFVIFKTLTGKGWGVKTRNLIKKDSFLFEYCGEFIEVEEADKRMSKYLYAIAEDEFREYTLDAGLYGNVARFVNHSCKPNAAIFKVNDCMLLPENSRLCLFADRDIQPGEELTINYRPSKSEDVAIITDCSCGEKKCRKVIK